MYNEEDINKNLEQYQSILSSGSSIVCSFQLFFRETTPWFFDL